MQVWQTVALVQVAHPVGQAEQAAELLQSAFNANSDMVSMIAQEFAFNAHQTATTVMAVAFALHAELALGHSHPVLRQLWATLTVILDGLQTPPSQSDITWHQINANNAHTIVQAALTAPSASTTVPRTTFTIPPPINAYQMELQESSLPDLPSWVLYSISSKHFMIYCESHITSILNSFISLSMS